MAVSLAYVDTSAIVAVLFKEPGAARIKRVLDSVDRLFSSALLEAELRSTCKREGLPIEVAQKTTRGLSFVLPDRRLSAEIGATLEAGYLRGADLWHVATALFLAERPESLPFLTCDEAQRDVALKLGFPDALA